MAGWVSSTLFDGWLRSFSPTTTQFIGLIRLNLKLVTSPNHQRYMAGCAGEAVGDPMTNHRAVLAAQVCVAFGLASLVIRHVRKSRGRAFASGELCPRFAGCPGSTLGSRGAHARGSPRSRSPRGVVFVCYSALLGAVWSIFASLALYVDGVLITAVSTYWCLLILSTLLAIAAEARLLLRRPRNGRRAAPTSRESYLTPRSMIPKRRQPRETRAIPSLGRSGWRHPSRRWIVRIRSPSASGAHWLHLDGVDGSSSPRQISPSAPPAPNFSFQIVHHQSDNTTFQLTAAWLGNPSQPLAKSVALSVGPNQTYQGTLVVPSATQRVYLSYRRVTNRRPASRSDN